MADLIPLAELLAEIDREIKRVPACTATLQRARSIAMTIPTVEAEPVVRCKDCAEGDYPEEECGVMMYSCPLAGKRVRADFYCADGARRMDADAPERGREDLNG